MSLKPWVQACSGVTRGYLTAFLKDVCSRRNLPLKTLPLSLLLVEAVTAATLPWLFKAIVCPLAILLERAVLKKKHSQNPVGYATDAGRRADESLMEHLAAGRGSADNAARATFPEQHTRSYLLLRRRRKGPIVPAAAPDLRPTRTTILLRYFEACRRFFKTCNNLLLVTDGSRVGGAELQLFAIFGVAPDGTVGCGWAPPQDQPFV